MGMWLRRNRGPCGEAGSDVQEFLNASGCESREELLRGADSALRSHLERCQDCSRAVDEALEVRRMLIRGIPSAEDPGEMFTARVMRAIAAVEAERDSASGTWFALPALAARFAWVSAVALLLATTWAYEVHGPGAGQSSGNDISVSSLEPGTPATQDEVFASLAGREP
jgi:hypothetical protein